MPSKHNIKFPDTSNLQTDSTDIFLTDLDATVRSHETAKHTFAGIMLGHAMYLPKMEVLQEQVRYFLETLPKTYSIKALKYSLYLLRKSLDALTK
jgi:hypothetical protein